MTCIEQEKLNNISKRYDELISLGYEQNKLTKNKLKLTFLNLEQVTL